MPLVSTLHPSTCFLQMASELPMSAQSLAKLCIALEKGKGSDVPLICHVTLHNKNHYDVRPPFLPSPHPPTPRPQYPAPNPHPPRYPRPPSPNPQRRISGRIRGPKVPSRHLTMRRTCQTRSQHRWPVSATCQTQSWHTGSQM